MRERVVRRENGERVEEWSERRRRKRKMETPVGVAPEAQVVSRKMPKGGKVVQWTAVAWDAYVQRQRRYERGEGGGCYVRDRLRQDGVRVRRCTSSSSHCPG